MRDSREIHRLAAFTRDPEGGNPAGVWVGDTAPSDEEMQMLAREVGYSETAFVVPLSGRNKTIRYFSPRAEVPFCGHATIAAGVLLGQLQGEGSYRLQTQAGEVALEVEARDGEYSASLTSVPPQHRAVPPQVLAKFLELLDWQQHELDPEIPAALIYAGAWHLLLAASARARLQSLHYPFEVLRDLMLEHGLTTLQLVWRENETLFHSRNPFPVGDVVEDAATGAAAAALGGYLRDSGLLPAPARILLRQGEDMGRPSRLQVDIPATGGIRVSGNAVSLAGGVS